MITDYLKVNLVFVKILCPLVELLYSRHLLVESYGDIVKYSAVVFSNLESLYEGEKGIGIKSVVNEIYTGYHM